MGTPAPPVLTHQFLKEQPPSLAESGGSGGHVGRGGATGLDTGVDGFSVSNVIKLSVADQNCRDNPQRLPGMACPFTGPSERSFFIVNTYNQGRPGPWR